MLDELMNIQICDSSNDHSNNNYDDSLFNIDPLFTRKIYRSNTYEHECNRCGEKTSNHYSIKTKAYCGPCGEAYTNFCRVLTELKSYVFMKS